MNSTQSENSSHSNHLQFYILILGLVFVRGLFFSDFNLGLVSLFAIQVVFPLALGGVFFKYVGTNDRREKAIVCFLAISAAEIIAMTVYSFTAGLDHLKDSVSIAVTIASFLAQLAFFSFLLTIIFMVKGRSRRGNQSSA